MKIAEVKVSYTTTDTTKIKVDNSRKSYEVFINNWSKDIIELQEEFKILLLNNSNQLLGIYSLSRGGTAKAIVDIKLLFSVVLKSNARSIILGHNHPSGNLNPSSADKSLTNKIIKAGELLDIKVFDHLIITKNSYYSFADENLM